MEKNTVILGDCLQIMKGMANKSVDIIITDPPYGMNFQSNHRQVKHAKIQGDDAFPVEIFPELFRLARNAVYVFCRWDNLKDLPPPLKSILVWVKNNWSMGDLLHEHGRQYEMIAFYPMENHEFIKRIPDVIFANRTGNSLHPTEKPVELIKQIIDANVGDSVFDPFAGSGTTLVSAKELKRQYSGIEISPEYYKVINDRLAQDLLF